MKQGTFVLVNDDAHGPLVCWFGLTNSFWAKVYKDS